MIKQTGEQRLVEALSRDMSFSEHARRLTNEQLVREILMEPDVSILVEEACTRLDPGWMTRDETDYARMDPPKSRISAFMETNRGMRIKIALALIGIFLLLAAASALASQEWTVKHAVRYCEQQRQRTGRAGCQLPAGVVVRPLK